MSDLWYVSQHSLLLTSQIYLTGWIFCTFELEGAYHDIPIAVWTSTVASGNALGADSQFGTCSRSRECS
jgi:hypothetical protein